MHPSKFTLELRRRGRTAVLDLSGRLTANDGATVLRESVQKLVDEGEKRVLVNLAEVAFVDSAGLSALVTAAEALRDTGGLLRLEHAHGPVQRVLQITRLDKILPNFQDEEAALASFGE